jgi:hypothetical protein
MTRLYKITISKSELGLPPDSRSEHKEYFFTSKSRALTSVKEFLFEHKLSDVKTAHYTYALDGKRSICFKETGFSYEKLTFSRYVPMFKSPEKAQEYWNKCGEYDYTVTLHEFETGRITNFNLD